MMPIINAWSRSASWEKLFAMKQYSSGNRVDLFFDGSTAFQSIWSSIQEAKHRIWIETYQLVPDHVGLKTIQLLTEAAQRGVHVVLVYDPIGSYSLRASHVRPLLDANAFVLSYKKSMLRNYLNDKKMSLSTLWNNWIPPWLGRNHRKLVIIDDTAYCGGMNIGGDYAGKEVGGTGRFLDAFCLVRGPAMNHLVDLYLGSLWHTSPVVWEKLKEWIKKEKRLFEKTTRRWRANTAIQIIETDVLRNRRSIQEALLLKLNNAQNYCDIVTPYFLPPHNVEKAILEAAKRGVKIRLFTQGLCKTPIINEASNHTLGLFLQAGVKVYKMKDKELHSKIMVLDDLFGIVGSFNIDILSFDSNMEFGISMIGSEHTDKLAKHIQEEIVPKCAEMPLEEWKNRPAYQKFFHWLAYILCNICLSRKWSLKSLFRPSVI